VSKPNFSGDAKPQLGLRFGPVGINAVHLCVDMQRLFTPGAPWVVPWAERVLPAIATLCQQAPARSFFTRFLPPRSFVHATGSWQRYYRKWQDVTLEHLDPAFLELSPSLMRFVPPGRIFDKWVYSPWSNPALEQSLRQGAVDTLLVSGGETDICVLATVLGAIDQGYRVILVEDAICSSNDDTHDALKRLFLQRFDTQVELASCAEIRESWVA
jgi:nicotinamidase-related amidase